MKILFIVIIAISGFISTYVYSQSITNTLGTSGVFTIKDASSSYLTLSQVTGQVNILRTLRLENTTNPATGVIFKGTNRFIHNYFPGTSHNTFMGIDAGNFSLTTADYNTGIGFNSLISLTTGTTNTALGYQSMYSNTTGNYNTAVGYRSLIFNTTGTGNTSVGNGSLYLNTTGNENTAVGYRTLYNNTGNENTTLGYYSLFKNTTGNYNSASGHQFLYSNTTGDENTASGYQSLYSNTTGNWNTALGYKALYSNIGGYFNTAIGHQALFSNTYGIYNTALGYYSLYSNTTGDYNIALGYQSLNSNTIGRHNIAIGHSTGSTIITGNNLTCIGWNAEPTSSSAINQITLGDNTISSLRCNVTTISSLSDSRDKKNVTDLPLGLDFIMKVKPRIFNWDKREWYENNISDGSKMNETPTAGFIAQELDEVQTNENAEWMNLVLKDNPEKLEATSGNLLPVMVKAIQELKVESEKLKVENVQLKNELESLKLMNEKIVKLEKIVNELTSVKYISLGKENENKTITNEGDER